MSGHHQEIRPEQVEGRSAFNRAGSRPREGQVWGDGREWGHGESEMTANSQVGR